MCRVNTNSSTSNLFLSFDLIFQNLSLNAAVLSSQCKYDPMTSVTFCTKCPFSSNFENIDRKDYKSQKKQSCNHQKHHDFTLFTLYTLAAVRLN